MDDYSKDYPKDNYNKTEFSEYNKLDIQMMLTFILFISFCHPCMYLLKAYFIKFKNNYNKFRLPIHRIRSDDNLLLDECSICLEQYIKNDKIINLNCSHSFHKDCLNEWLKKNNTCPQCREIII
tara:strand:- start:15878 stop:16249 length:372 start_codon:yes stop_codon:yes gene_type:complete